MRKTIEKHEDERGFLVELFKSEGFGQVYYFTTKPGKTRGNHYHKRKKEFFFVLEGNGVIGLHNKETGELLNYEVSGEKPELIEIPLNHVHNVRNTGADDLKVVAWISEVFDPNDADTYYENV